MRATILCYHKVGPAAEEGRRLNIEPARLESHVRYFVRRGNPVRRAMELAGPWPDGVVCFTFDDAYESALRHATEVMERQGARGTFYAVVDKIGGSSDWDGSMARPLAALPLLLNAQAAGHEIGNHTLTHPHLDRLDLEAQEREVLEADRRLREAGIVPGSFCYPYGDFDPHAESIVARQYQVGVALRKRHATPHDPKSSLSRIVVAYSDSLPMLMYRLHVRPLLRRR